MEYHEREFFISLIRSGKVIIHYKDIRLEIRPLTIDQVLEANIVYKHAFENTFIDGIMTEYEMQEWMNENGLWTLEHENKIKSLKDDIERLKIEIYNYRHERKQREQIRKYLRLAEKTLSENLREKNSYFQNTREGYALSEKVSWIIKNSTYHKDKLYNFKDVSLTYIVDEWQNSILSENIIRELAREEPWKSLWSVRENKEVKLFNSNQNEELTNNQRHILIWSQIYDNIQESMDCPEDSVIKDDDMLDGWFIVQAQKRKAEKLEKELEHEIKNDKIKNSKEVFVVTRDRENQRRIDEMNDPIAKSIKKQRHEFIIQKGTVSQSELPDEKFDLQMQINNLSRNAAKGGR